MSGRLKYNPQSTESYYSRKIYVLGENKTLSTSTIEESSFVKVEINKDNARGYVYYSDGNDFTGTLCQKLLNCMPLKKYSIIYCMPVICF